MIIAIADNNVIGKSGELLPWHLPADLKHFKDITMGHPIIMGRKTYETINRPLPGRTNIIVTRGEDYAAEGCEVAHSLDEALKVAAQSEGGEESFIIGGANLYQQALPSVDKVYLTRIHSEPEGDIKFELDEAGWRQIASEPHQADERNEIDYDFIELTKTG